MEELESPEPAHPVDALLDVAAQFGRMSSMLQGAQLEAIDQARRVAATESLPIADRDLARRSFRAEVAIALGVSERSAEWLIADAEALSGPLAATRRALAEGRISMTHARVLVRETTGLDDEQLADVERRALTLAAGTTPSRFATTVRRLRERRCPEIAAERHRAAVRDRSVTLEPALDGMADLLVHLPAVEGVAILERLDAAARSLHHDGDPRGVGQLRVDILCDVLLDRHATDSRFRSIDAQVNLTVPVLTLLGRDIEPAELDGYGPIDLATAAGLIGQATTLRRVLTDPHTGIRLAFGRERYRVDPDLRRWLRLRDGSCRFPGCTRSTRFCDLDHGREWASDRGRSDDVNLGHLCRGHHTLKSVGLWSVVHCDRGTLRWTSPHGRRSTTHPDGADPPG